VLVLLQDHGALKEAPEHAAGATSYLCWELGFRVLASLDVVAACSVGPFHYAPTAHQIVQLVLFEHLRDAMYTVLAERYPTPPHDMLEVEFCGAPRVNLCRRVHTEE
jgi:hypothetical protein